MRKSILVSILLIGAVFCAYGQAGSDPIDLVLLLDTSSSMSSSYDRVNDYTTNSFLSEFLRVGDTFHLIPYSGKPRLDVARRITSRGDIETIVGRILLQYPVESGNDARAAIAFAEQYVASLPARPKKIVMVGTGGADVSGLVNAAKQRLASRNITFDYVQVNPGQPLANLPSSGRGAARATPSQTAQPGPATPQRSPGATGTQLATQPPSRTGTQTPQTQQPSTAPTTQTQTPGTPSTQQTQQPTPGATDTRTTPASPAATGATGTTGGVSSTGTSPAATGPSGAVAGTSPSGSQDTQRPSTGPEPFGTSPTPSGTASGEPSGGIGELGETDQGFAAGDRDATQESTRPTPQKLKTFSGEGWASSIPLIIGFVILALLVLFLIIFLASRRLGSRPNRVMAAVSSSRPESDTDLAPFVDHSKDLASYAASVKAGHRSTPYTAKPIKPETAKPAVINPTGPLLLNLFVDDQNTAIGKRNIHSLKSGYGLSVGGGKGDDFFIFLVPMPSNLGEIRRNGSQCSFIPRKPRYFPDLGSNELRDCINKTIRIVSDKNYEITFRFEMYEDPLVALNRVLNSVKVPG